MKNETDHGTLILAQSAFGVIQRCRCEGYHLNLRNIVKIRREVMGRKKNLRGISYALLICMGVVGWAPWILAQETEKNEKKQEKILEEVVITGTRTEHPEKDAPVETEVVTQKDIEEAAATDIREVLQDLPSVTVRRVPARFPSFQIQGMQPLHTLILRNGQELIGVVEGTVVTSDLLTSEIDRIEVVKGANSVLYGSDAIGGVVNIVTKKATQPFGGSLESRFETFRTLTTLATVEGKGDRLGAFLSAGISTSDGFDLNPATPETDGPAFTNKSFSGNFDIALTSTLDLSLYTVYGKAERSSLFNPITAGPPSSQVPSIRQSFSDTTRNQNILDLTMRPDPLSTLRFTGHYQTITSESTQIRRDTNAVLPNLTSERKQTLSEGELGYTRLIGESHLISLGGEIEREEVEGVQRGKPTFKGENPDVNEYGLYAQDEFEITRMITLVAGGRYTDNGQFGSDVTPQATLFFKPGNLRARLFYGEGFRAPDLGETHFEFIEGGGNGIIGNPDLEPEESKSVSAGVEYYFSQAKIGASVFRHRVENLISFVIGTCTPEEAARLGVLPSRCAKTDNIGETQFQGVEAEAGIRLPGNIALEAGYLYLSATDEQTDAFLFQRPRNSAKGKLVWDSPLGISLTTRVRYQGPFGLSDFRRGTPPATNRRIDEDEKTDNSTEIDIRLAKVIGKVTFYAGVDNVTDEERKVVDPTGAIIFDRSAFPRTWYGGARVVF